MRGKVRKLNIKQILTEVIEREREMHLVVKNHLFDNKQILQWRYKEKQERIR